MSSQSAISASLQTTGPCLLILASSPQHPALLTPKWKKASNPEEEAQSCRGETYYYADTVLTWILMTYYYNHLTKYLTTLIWETSICDRWGLTQWSTTAQSKEKDYRMLNHKGSIYHIHLPKAWESFRKKMHRRRIIAIGSKWLQKYYIPDIRTAEHIKPQRLV